MKSGTKQRDGFKEHKVGKTTYKMPQWTPDRGWQVRQTPPASGKSSLLFQPTITVPGPAIVIRRIRNGFLMRYTDGAGNAEVFVKDPSTALRQLTVAMEALR